MAAVELDKASIEQLEAEATRNMETSIAKCYHLRGASHLWQARTLLA